MFVEIFITIPFINGIELGLQDTGGMLKLGCDQKSGPLNHASTQYCELWTHRSTKSFKASLAILQTAN